MKKIKVGIVGHGNLGKGVEKAISHTGLRAFPCILSMIF